MNIQSPNARISRWQRLTAALLALSAVLFVIGALLERTSLAGEPHTDEPPAATQVTGTHVETGNEAAEAPTTTASSAPAPETQSETTLGFNLENPWLVGGFALASLVLAAALLRFGWPALLLAIVVGAGAALFDVQEVLTQLGRGQLPLAGLAALVAVTHLAVAVLASLAWANGRSAPTGRLGETH